MSKRLSLLLEEYVSHANSHQVYFYAIQIGGNDRQASGVTGSILKLYCVVHVIISKPHKPFCCVTPLM